MKSKRLILRIGATATCAVGLLSVAGTAQATPYVTYTTGSTLSVCANDVTHPAQHVCLVAANDPSSGGPSASATSGEDPNSP